MVFASKHVISSSARWQIDEAAVFGKFVASKTFNDDYEHKNGRVELSKNIMRRSRQWEHMIANDMYHHMEFEPELP